MAVAGVAHAAKGWFKHSTVIERVQWMHREETLCLVAAAGRYQFMHVQPGA